MTRGLVRRGVAMKLTTSRTHRYAVFISGEGIWFESDVLWRAMARFEFACRVEPAARITLHDGRNGCIVARQEGQEEESC